MLANLTSWLWGSPDEPSLEEPGVPPETEWVFVDKNDVHETRSVSSAASSSDWLLTSSSCPFEELPCPADHSPFRPPATPAAESESVEPSPPDTPAVQPTRTAVSQRAAKLLLQVEALKPSQKGWYYEQQKYMKQKHLKRQNKTREVSSCSKRRTKRKDRMDPTNFSRAVNNRKC